MAEAKRGFGGQPADREGLDVLTVGSLSFAVEYRHVGEERGPSVHVFGDVDGADEEVLRFDCFERTPHYHYGFSYIDQPMTLIDTAAVGDPLKWVCERIGERLPAMLEKADAPQLAADCDPAALRAVAAQLLVRGEALRTQAATQQQ